MEIVDDQHDRSDLLGELRHDSVDQLIAVGRSGLRGLRLRFDRVCQATDRAQDRAPEPLRILLVAVDGHERDAMRVGRAVDPRTQQRGLPTSGRRRNDRHPLGHSAIQRLEEVFPVEQAPGGRNGS